MNFTNFFKLVFRKRAEYFFQLKGLNQINLANPLTSFFS
jgi:hypothetical protein